MKDETLEVLFEDFLKEINKSIDQIKKMQTENISEAAELVTTTLTDDGLIHVFGTGHSQILADEVFFRAGELVPINPLIDPGVALREGGTRCSKNERLEGYAKIIFDYYNLEKKDIMIIISNSGRNAVPIEMAMEAQKKGLKVVAITSLEISKSLPSRHSSGMHLSDVADVVIDNYIPPGEATVRIEGFEQKMGPISTIVNVFIIHMIMMRATQRMLEQEKTPSVWMCPNIKGADKFNAKFIQRYKGRIKHL